MNVVVFLLNILIVVVVSGGPAWKEEGRRGMGLKIGNAGKSNISSRANGLRLGGSTRGSRTTTALTPTEDEHIPPPTVPTSPSSADHLHVGMVVPYKSFGVREYTKAITSAKYNLQRKLKIFKNHDIQVHIVMKELTPSPTGRRST
ncbi:hypothetical protein WA026_013056 [Henosepilachna vigintioctopunctata]|uniref:Uncharacterized protein n=1 Tax=Henosepilachna vigintioctopunctata TaxID=420089 RepID=A0AAW1UJM3_9CUCU